MAIGGYNGQPVLFRNTATTVSANMIVNTGENSTDSGGIYVLDRTGQDTGITIVGNEVNGTGQEPYIGGIYLDDYTSGVAVTNNIVRCVSVRDLQLYGGRNDTVTNNIFDLGGTTAYAVLLQAASSNIVPDTGAPGRRQRHAGRQHHRLHAGQSRRLRQLRPDDPAGNLHQPVLRPLRRVPGSCHTACCSGAGTGVCVDWAVCQLSMGKLRGRT